LNLELVGDIPLPVVPLPEQTAIAEFLDRETGKIDELAAEQRRLIELLKEKCQAVISHAVTKGLNPHVPMKPSGVEWLGDVPEHWDVMAIKRIVSEPITDGPHETPEFLDEGVPFVSAEAVSSGRIDFSKIRGHISAQDNERYSQKYSPKLHDIYMVKSGATTGVTAIVDGRTDFNIWSPLAVIRCGEKSTPYFVLNFMRSRNFSEGVMLNWSFGTQQNIGMGVIGNLACTIPPLPEQTAIAEFVGAELAKFDSLTAEAQHAIDLLQERRTALISAAVTGQIDVR
jgi:type I restriction enzyme S subunit